MQTECYQESFGFKTLGRREVVGHFDGGAITSDGGGLLLREVDDRLRLLERFAACFRDHRNPEAVEFTTDELVSQRMMGLALGYEDLNDHDELRVDPLLAVLAGHKDPSGADRVRPQDRGKALAGKSTLNRLELSTREQAAGERYKRIAVESDEVDRLRVDIFMEAHEQAPPNDSVHPSSACPKAEGVRRSATDGRRHGCPCRVSEHTCSMGVLTFLL